MEAEWLSAKDQGASAQDSPLTNCKGGVEGVAPAWTVEFSPKAMNVAKDKAG
jgi:hypothetical protein